jgi:phosphoglycolate phosphatase-like HAD superfamily hydrolase
MTLRGMIFDIDGTLVDTNPAHVLAWQRAFARFEYDVPIERIEIEIGKGGDKLVPSVLGEAVEARIGEALRRAQKEEFLAIARSEHFRLFPGVPEIFTALHDRGIRSALATSSDEKHLQATLTSAGLDLTTFVDVVVTKSDAVESKPAPDIVVTTVERLGLSTAECAMLGDTVYDAQACLSAGVVFLGVLSGGTPEAELLQAGAIAVWRDVAHLLQDLDRVHELVTHTGAAAR